MTKQELSQFYYLKKELRWLRQRLEALEAEGERATTCASGLPRGGGLGDKVGKAAAELVQTREILEALEDRCLVEYRKLNGYIAGIGDSLMRQIMTLRHVEGRNWTQVAMGVGGGNTPDGVRKAHDRYLKRTSLSAKSEGKGLDC